jgi:uncharacterized membrane protein YbhN (UPF0104 family)
VEGSRRVAARDEPRQRAHPGGGVGGPSKAPGDKRASPKAAGVGPSPSFERVRRPADLLWALASFSGAAAALGIYHTLPVGSAEVARGIAGWFRAIPQGLTFAISLLVSLAALALVLVILGVLIRREPRGALNAAVAAVLGAAAATAATTIWHGQHGVVSHLVLAGRNPSTFIVDTTFFAFLTATDVVRRPRWTRWCVMGALLLLLGDVAVGALAPLGSVIVLLGGLGSGWLVRWALGARSLRPSLRELIGELDRCGLRVVELAAAEEGHKGSLRGRLEDGTPIEVRIANRDTAGAGILRAFWARIRLRPVVSGHPTLTSRAELERLALAAYVAADAGVLAPRALLLTELSGESLVLVLGGPGGESLAASASKEAAAKAFEALRRLHKAGVAHRLLRAESLVVKDGSVGFASLDEALPGASELVRRLDVTQLLTTLARLLGAPAAVWGMREGYRPEDEEAIVAILQPLALAPWGWSAMREAKGSIGELRAELFSSEEGVREERLERFRWRTVLSAVALTLAAYVLVGELATVDLLAALQHMKLGWFFLAVLGSAITYFAAAANLAAFVPARPHLLRGFFVQLASAFVGIAMPPTVGHVAVNARYLHRRKVHEAAIAAAVALSQITNVLTTLLVLLAIGLLTGSGISRLHIVPSTEVLSILGGVAVLAAILLAIPPTRSLITHRIWPRLHSVWPRLLEAVSQPVRLAAGMGADLLLIGGYALAFLASIKAMGASAPVLLAVAVYLGGNAIGTAAPTPGGLGAVETVLVVGLTGIGVPAREAIPAVLVFRLATFWLPIPAGWISFLVLQRSGTL